MREMRSFCCKLFAGLCIVGAGGVVGLAGVPLVAAGKIVSCSALTDVRKAAQSPGPCAPHDPADLGKRWGRLGEGGMQGQES